MKINRVLILLVAIVSLLLYWSFVSNIGIAMPLVKYQDSRNGKFIKRIVNENGWYIPGWVDNLSIKSVEKIKAKDLIVEKRLYYLNRKPLVKMDSFKLEGAQLIVSSAEYQVGNIFSYCTDKNTHIFAFEVYLTPIATEVDGTKTPAGAIIPVRFYDEDGSGKFKLRVYELSEVNIPLWAKGKF
jgi:hypothetical protein